MEDVRQQKQKYLRESILQKSYDAQQFMDFCQSYKGSTDIDGWTLNQLKEIVQKFIRHETENSKEPSVDWDNVFTKSMSDPKPQNKSAESVQLNSFDLDFLECMGMNAKGVSAPVQKQYEVPKKAQKDVGNTNKEFITNPNEILSKLNDKNNNFISAFNQNGFKKEVEVNKKKPEIIEPNIQAEMTHASIVINNQPKEAGDEKDKLKTTVKTKSFTNKPKLLGEYEVVVNAHEVVNPNMFVPNFVLYTITTNPLNVQVKRRMKDFEQLRKILRRVFPTTQIPHLERFGRLSETEPAIIKKQKLFIQSFMNSLLMISSLRCKILDDFLLCTNLDTLKKAFRQYEKLQKPKCIEDLFTPEGKVNLNLCNENKKYVNQQDLLFEYLHPNLIKLKSMYNNLLESFAGTIKIMNGITQIYDNMQQNFKIVNNTFSENYQCHNIEKTFEKISDMHKHWSISIKTQSKLIDAEIRHLYRFEQQNLQTIRDVTKLAINMTDAYQKRSDKQIASRENYQYNKKLNDFKNGVDTPSKNTTVLKYQVAYIQEQAVNQIKKYFDSLSQKMTKKFKIFSILQLNIGGQLENCWKDFEKYASISQE